jgi:type 1 glutamine amidotransferase
MQTRPCHAAAACRAAAEPSSFSSAEGTQFKKGGKYPQAWVRDYGEERVPYTSFGHRDDIWSVDPVF